MRPQAQALVDSFGIPDHLVAAPIAGDWEKYNEVRTRLLLHTHILQSHTTAIELASCGMLGAGLCSGGVMAMARMACVRLCDGASTVHARAHTTRTMHCGQLAGSASPPQKKSRHACQITHPCMQSACMRLRQVDNKGELWGVDV